MQLFAFRRQSATSASMSGRQVAPLAFTNYWASMNGEVGIYRCRLSAIKLSKHNRIPTRSFLSLSHDNYYQPKTASPTLRVLKGARKQGDKCGLALYLNCLVGRRVGVGWWVMVHNKTLQPLHACKMRHSHFSKLNLADLKSIIPWTG